MRIRPCRPPLLAAALLLATASARAAGVAVPKLAPDSPLATDGSVVFAVADDRKTLLVGLGSDWNVLLRTPSLRRVRGLAWSREGLYVSDEEGGAVHVLRNPTAPGVRQTLELVRKGPPFRAPADLAFAGSLLVADPGTSSLYVMGRTPEPPQALASVLPPGPIQVAADRGELVIVSPDSAEVRQPLPSENVYYQRKGTASFKIWRTAQPGVGPDSTRTQVRGPLLKRPSAPALLRGMLFLVDAATGDVYVGQASQRRLVRVPRPPTSEMQVPARLLPFRESLVVLDGRKGAVESWPLPVPTEVDLGQRVPEALPLLYGFLYEARWLPTRSVRWAGSLDATIQAAGIALGPPSENLRLLMCTLNRPTCGGGQWAVPAGAELLVPDVPLETVIDVDSVAASELGDRTVRQEVERRVVSPAFADYKLEHELWELNASALRELSRDPKQSQGRPAVTSSTFATLRSADFPEGFRLTLPTERVRALVALPRQVLRESHVLDRIRLISPGFSWEPLEQTDAKAYGTEQDPPAPAPVACDEALLKSQRKRLHDTIHYTAPSPMPPAVNVGVVEVKAIDQGHAAFAGTAFSPLPAHGPTPPASTDPLTCRDRQVDGDHGTAVASLIASRAAGEMAGLAPAVQIVPMLSDDSTVGKDIFDAIRLRKVRIFNLSLHYGDKLVRNVRDRINQFAKEALFVVAAGNDATDNKPVCESWEPFPAYPVCQEPRNNVLIVAATNMADDVALIDKTQSPPAPGSNWNERLVEIAAPGTGFHAAARGNGYAPVRGTSFATPLVTATAALLYAKGVQSPWLIKQRIIASADQRANLIGRVRGGAFLNVDRAVGHPDRAVLEKEERRPDGSKHRVRTVVALEPTTIEIVWDQGAQSRKLPLDNIRRITKTDTATSCRVIYLDDITDRLIIQDDVNPGPWPFRYREFDAAGNLLPGVKTGQLENFADYLGPVI